LTYTTRNFDYSQELISKGAKLCISDVKKSKSSIVIRHKTSNYLENLIVLQKAKEESYDDAIFLNEQGFVTETTKANIFGVIDNNIITPKLECGLLPGIIREWVINNSFQFGCGCVEDEITQDRLKNFEEVFITNSIFGAMHVWKIDEKIINKEKCGKITHEINKFLHKKILGNNNKT
jgi:branched-subunit amino acid aminotransferase/4-amino-4-deoxychorismate lyase